MRRQTEMHNQTEMNQFTSDRISSFFPAIKNSTGIIEAVLHADEEMVLKILAADPRYLTQIGTAIDLQGNSFTGTPLQAALHTTDVQLCEKMKPYFAQIEQGQMEMDRQFREIYKESLRAYFDKQEAEIKYLNTFKKEKGQFVDRINAETEIEYLNTLKTLQNEKGINTLKKEKGQFFDRIIARAQYRFDHYLTALKSDDISLILKTHDQAQEDNAFDFQPYVDAILNASEAELDDVMELINATTSEETIAAIVRTGVASTQTDAARAKPFDELTLVEKLNRFREKLTEHMQQEIIFNPNHILTGLKHNEKTWDEVDAHYIADPNYKKRTVIFSQLVGFAQRNAAEPVKQDIRQGTWYLAENNEAHTRPSRFNDYRGSGSNIFRNCILDISLVNSSAVDGLGYKFVCEWRCLEEICMLAKDTWQKLCREKTIRLSELVTKPEHSCVIS